EVPGLILATGGFRHGVLLAPLLSAAAAALVTGDATGMWDTPGADLAGVLRATDRSEEHTSELQSRENLVCRLLLEKKNKHKAPYRHLGPIRYIPLALRLLARASWAALCVPSCLLVASAGCNA